ncbi:MAG: glycosyltransferase [Alphaproteobacteria bacterium]|nr:glycosyltransferase [Alphaproteobacteria bacterium]
MFQLIIKFTHQTHRLAIKAATDKYNTKNTDEIKKKTVGIIVSVKNIVKYFPLFMLTKRPCLLYYTGLGRLYVLNGWIGKLLVFSTAYLLDRWCGVGFIVENQQNKEYFEKFVKNPVYLVSGSGLYPDYFNHMKNFKEKPYPNAQKTKRLGYIARFGPLKHSELILQIVENLSPTTEIFIAGRDVKSNFYKKKFQALAQKNSNIHFIGYLENHKQVSDFYNQIDFLLHPSMSEGLPLTLLESIFHHVPFITTPVCGCDETAHTFDCPAIPAEQFVDFILSGDYQKHMPDRQQWQKKLQPFYHYNVQKEFEEILQHTSSHKRVQ